MTFVIILVQMLCTSERGEEWCAGFHNAEPRPFLAAAPPPLAAVDVGAPPPSLLWWWAAFFCFSTMM